jgi:hypothetical protein
MAVKTVDLKVAWKVGKKGVTTAAQKAGSLDRYWAAMKAVTKAAWKVFQWVVMKVAETVVLRAALTAGTTVARKVVKKAGQMAAQRAAMRVVPTADSSDYKSAA